LPSIGKQIISDDIVLGLEEVIDVRGREPRRFGTAGPRANLFRDVWKDELHVFAAEGLNVGVPGTVTELGHPDRTASNILNKYPVEVLAIEETMTSREEKE
jgi:hypothetical protein